MARRGSVKYLSIQQENYLAALYGGKRSASSGAADNDAGDVRTSHSLIECKMTGNPGKEPKALPIFVQDFVKIADEAWSEGREPALALRYYQPQSVLANSEGWIDLTVRLTADDADRERRVYHANRC